MSSVPESTYSYARRRDDASFFLEELSYNLDSFYFDHLIDMMDMCHLGNVLVAVCHFSSSSTALDYANTSAVLFHLISMRIASMQHLGKSDFMMAHCPSFVLLSDNNF